MTAASAIDSRPANAQASGSHFVSGFNAARLHAWVVAGLLQLSHRIGAIALLATLASWAIMYQGHNFHVPLAVAAGASDIGLCAALLARMLVRHSTRLRREANGVAIFNLVLFILTIYFMIFSRTDVIHAEASAFFTPTTSGPQG